MEPTLQAGDKILVNKMVMGARLFNISAALENKDIAIYRVPGSGKLHRNDVLVFNFPYGKKRKDSIRFDVMQYYVKRCVGLPGDTLEIRQGLFRIRGVNEVLGNARAQGQISEMLTKDEKSIVLRAFPRDKKMGWTVLEFGPLPVPKQGQVVKMNRENGCLYKQLLGWEQKKKVTVKDDAVMIGDSVINEYQFEKNYYFVAGDKADNSQDSRYWGMLPEDYIVGKAIRIWSSIDRYTGRVLWERVMKKIK